MVFIAQTLETPTWGNTHRSPDRRMLRPQGRPAGPSPARGTPPRWAERRPV